MVMRGGMHAEAGINEIKVQKMKRWNVMVGMCGGEVWEGSGTRIFIKMGVFMS